MILDIHEIELTNEAGAGYFWRAFNSKFPLHTHTHTEHTLPSLMLKREDPFTPQPRRGKKIRDYASPIVKTPLRNMLSAENIASKAIESNVNNVMEQQAKRTRAALLRGATKKAALLSPAPGISPRAAPLSMNSPAAATVLRNSPSLLTLNGNAPPPTRPHHQMSMAEMNRAFEEWMRIAADNKINAKNTWNVALIDYFSELSFLRDADGQAINFQKASCTLDGCVKIYSSRVDSVVDATGKLLTGLNERSTVDEAMAAEEDEEGEEEEEGKAKKKSSRPPGLTLEKNADNLRGRLDLLEGGTIDPLFRKTCADFDEASGGTLLFNLPIDQEAKIVFDSVNTSLPQADQVDDDDVVPVTVVDASQLLAQFGAALTSLEDASLTATLDNYSFLETLNSNSSNNNNEIHDRLAAALEKLTVQQEEVADAEQNPFGHEAAVPISALTGVAEQYYDYDEPIVGDECDLVGTNNNNNAVYYDSISQLAGQFIPGGGPPPVDSFSVHNDRLKWTWAGAEHWKIKRVAARRITTINESSSQSSSALSVTKQAKRLSQINFDTVDIDLEHLLAKGQSLVLSGDRDPELTTLPDDLHITGALFTRLFTRPSWHFSRVVVRSAITTAEGRAESIAHQERVDFVPLPGEPKEDEEEIHVVDGGIDAHDYFDDDDDDNTPLPTIDLGQLVAHQQQQQQQHDAALPLSAGFARRPKRINVRMLKDCLSKSISGPTTMSQVVAALPGQYADRPEAERADLSVQFAFLCLLHLANEHGLVLDGQPDGDVMVTPL